MSHVTTLDFSFDNIEALQAACRELNLIFQPSRKSFRMYGNTNVPCDHVIHVPGASYEIGLRRQENRLVPFFDPYSKGGLTTALGNGLHKLLVSYTVHRLKSEAKKRKANLTVSRQPNSTRITLTL